LIRASTALATGLLKRKQASTKSNGHGHYEYNCSAKWRAQFGAEEDITAA
jgi:hypothetical protein